MYKSLATGSSRQKIESRAEKGAVMIQHVLSGWLASSYPIRSAFLQHISERNNTQTAVTNMTKQRML